MRDILVNTPVSLVIIDKRGKKKDLKNDLYGLRIIMCLINEVCHVQTSQLLTHTPTHFFPHWHFKTFHPDTSACGITAGMSTAGLWPFQTPPSPELGLTRKKRKKKADFAGANTSAN